MKLEVFTGALHVGTLEHDRDLAQWRFEYAPQWQAYEESYPLCPALPLKTDAAQPREEHSRNVRFFFENLLPEEAQEEGGQRRARVGRGHRHHRAHPGGVGLQVQPLPQRGARAHASKILLNWLAGQANVENVV